MQINETTFNNLTQFNYTISTIESIINNSLLNATIKEVNSTENGTLPQEILPQDTLNIELQLFPWIFSIYMVNIGLGMVFNLISLIALLRTKRNGTLSIILQITIIDILSGWTCIVELLTLKSKSWNFPSETCPVFAGVEILSNTLTLYLIISINYHTISLCNLKMNLSTITQTQNHRQDASQECLVRDSSQSTQQKDISIVIPCILLWFACISLSIPQFTLSSTVESSRTKNVICTLTDVYFGRMLINLLVIFRVLVPIAFMTCSTCLLGVKLYTTTRNDSIPNLFTKKCHNVVYYLIFCLALNFLYVTTSLQRLILYAMHAYHRHDMGVNNIRIFRLPPLYNQFGGELVTTGLSMLHYSGTFLRFLIYVFLLPKFKSILCNNFLTCFKPKEL